MNPWLIVWIFSIIGFMLGLGLGLRTGELLVAQERRRYLHDVRRRGHHEAR